MEKSEKRYRFFTKFTAICVLVVVLAGSLVKVTGSGMGCPDWPKCLGHYIPPFSEDEVIWNENNAYFKGQMVLHQGRWFTALDKIPAHTQFNSQQWELFTKHNYTTYNPTHTFIEYINRLATVVLGVVVLLMLWYAFKIRAKSYFPLIFSIVIFILILFEAWLGRLVVDSDLSPIKISIHLYAALLIVAIVGAMLAITGKARDFGKYIENKQLFLLWMMLLILSGQMFLGTKLREMIDVFARQNLFLRENWIEQSGLRFIVHRSFSLIYLALVVVTYVKTRYLRNEYPFIQNLFTILLSVLGLEILSGVIMAYFSVPAAMQPTHVVISGALILSQTYLTVKFFWEKKIG
jgi:cytochrome c oxidase assembly protein subunit 15